MDFTNRGEESYNAALTASFRKQLTKDLNGKLSLRSFYDRADVAQVYRLGRIVPGEGRLPAEQHEPEQERAVHDPEHQEHGCVRRRERATTRAATSSRARTATTAARSSATATAGHRSVAFPACGACPRSRSGAFDFMNDFRLRASRGTRRVDAALRRAVRDVYGRCHGYLARSGRQLEPQAGDDDGNRDRHRLHAVQPAWCRGHERGLQDEEPDPAGEHAGGARLLHAVAERRHARRTTHGRSGSTCRS